MAKRPCSGLQKIDVTVKKTERVGEADPKEQATFPRKQNKFPTKWLRAG